MIRLTLLALAACSSDPASSPPDAAPVSPAGVWALSVQYARPVTCGQAPPDQTKSITVAGTMISAVTAQPAETWAPAGTTLSCSGAVCTLDIPLSWPGYSEVENLTLYANGSITGYGTLYIGGVSCSTTIMVRGTKS